MENKESKTEVEVVTIPSLQQSPGLKTMDSVDENHKIKEGDELTDVPLKEEVLTIKEAFFGALSRGNKWKKIVPIVLTLIMDVVLPVALYFILKKYLAAVWALLIAGAPALLAVVLKGIIKRQLDIIGLLVFVAFGISAVVAIVSGDPRILVFEKSMVTGILGIIFLLSLIPIRIKPMKRGCKPCKKGFRLKPFLFYVIRQVIPIGKVYEEEKSVLDPKHRDKFDWLYEKIPTFKSVILNLTIFWGVGFFIEFIARLAMVLSPMTLDQVVLYANIAFAVIIAIQIIFSVVYGVYIMRYITIDIEEWLKKHERHMMLGEEDDLALLLGAGESTRKKKTEEV